MSQRERNDSLTPFNASKYHVGIVVAQFNSDITESLLNSALEEAKRYKIPSKNIIVKRVSGCVEIPVVLKAMAQRKKYDALVVFGAVIRGETDHYTYVANIVSDGVLSVMMDYGTPVGFGVLTCENSKQAKARLDLGAGALAAAIQGARIIKEL